jgi:hypothetical protein
VCEWEQSYPRPAKAPKPTCRLRCGPHALTIAHARRSVAGRGAIATATVCSRSSTIDIRGRGGSHAGHSSAPDMRRHIPTGLTVHLLTPAAHAGNETS